MSIKPTVLGEGAPRLQVYINAVELAIELAIIANSIASNIILKAVCTTGALSNSSIMMMLGKEPERNLSGPESCGRCASIFFHHGSVSHSVSLFVSPFHWLHGSLQLLDCLNAVRFLMPVRLTL